MCCDGTIRCVSESYVSRELCFMAKADDEFNDRARKICVDQEAHWSLGRWQWMERLLLSEFAHELQGCANVFGREIVFTLDLFEGHPASQASNNDSDRHARAADHGFAVADVGIKNDAVLSVHGDE
jgi:hypothetical protein